MKQTVIAAAIIISVVIIIIGIKTYRNFVQSLIKESNAFNEAAALLNEVKNKRHSNRRPD